MNTVILKMGKLVFIGLIVAGSIAFFGYQLYRNMGKGSRASISGTVNITLSNSITDTVPAGETFTVGVNLAANAGMSAIDLYFTDPKEALDFVLPTTAFPLEEQSIKAFDETVRLATTSRSDGSKRLDRITIVSKRTTASLKQSAVLRLRFKARSTAAASYPSVVTFGLNTGSSVITGPGVNGNKFSLSPASPTLSISLACSAAAGACTTGQVCYKSACNNPCGTGGTCAGLYHCENNVCVPGAGGGSSSSSSTSYAPTATPIPTPLPDKANLLFKVNMPDVASWVSMVPQVRVQVLSSPVIEKVINLYREPGKTYFKTNSPLELDIPAGSARQYTILIKQLKTIQRSFTAQLQKGTVSDCITAASSCGGGTLGSPGATGRELWSGDSDGFASGTGSPNVIDGVDKQKVADGYLVTPLPAEPNGDFNLDGKVDIHDLGILGKNWGIRGQ